ncbi:MAG: caspase family protein [Bacteroidales bacterium]|nr:caspase family protein [Bacteroidales bacterium]
MREINTIVAKSSSLKVLTLAFFCSLFSLQTIAQDYEKITEREEWKNSDYRSKAVSIIKNSVRSNQIILNRKAERMLLNLPLQEKLYDEGKVIITSEIVYDTLESGDVEMNYLYEISYQCINPNGDSDDYPAGTYNYSESNSCRAICNLTKQFLNEDCKEFFPEGKDIDILITSTTDAQAIAGIEYKGEYGDFRYTPVTFDNIPTRLTLFSNDIVTTNSELAFLRAQSVKDFLQKSINALGETNNKYELETWQIEELGSHYRRSSIRILVHNPFEEKIEMMVQNMKATDTDIDINIPEVEPTNKNAFVLILSNEKYQYSFPDVDYAANDSKVFREYCTKILGIPERHIRLLENPTRNEIQKDGLDWLKNLMKVTNGTGNIIIYYTGYGIVDYENLPYIIPADAKSLTTTKWGKSQTDDKEAIPLTKKEVKRFLEECMSLEEMCTQFDKVPANSLTIFCDAGFDGKLRDGNTLITYPRNTGKTKGMRLRGNAVIFCAADFTQTVYGFNDKQHGFFTYYLLKTLRENMGNLDFGQLFDEIKDAVSFESSLQGKQQIPTIIVGGKVKDTWSKHKLK